MNIKNKKKFYLTSHTDLSHYGNIAATSDFGDSAMHLKFLHKIQRICNAIDSYRASLIITIPHFSNVAFSINIVLTIVLTLSDRVFLFEWLMQKILVSLTSHQNFITLLASFLSYEINQLFPPL